MRRYAHGMRIFGRLLLVVLWTTACGDDDGAPDGAAGDVGRDATTDATDGGVREDGSTDGGTDDGGTRDGGSDAGTVATCAPLPMATGEVIDVTPAQANDLPQIVRDAAAGATIVLAPGTYRIAAEGEANRRLQFHRMGVTLRSSTDDATDVILDGEYRTNEMIFIDANDVTIAHITLTHAIDHGIHVSAPGAVNVTGARLYGLRMVDHGEQFVKVNPNGDRTGFVDEGELACSSFLLTDAGRPMIERSPGGCYTGGIDAHGSRDWVVRDNRFEDIYCAGEGLSEHAIHFWSASRDTLVERNVILGCARGVGLGLVEDGRTRDYADDPYPGFSGYIGHYGGVVRSNVIYADHPYYDTGIELAQARGARVIHNTVVSGDGATGRYSSIDYRFSSTDVEIRNNLVRRITQRNGAMGDVMDNLEMAPLSLFVSPSAGDLHLRDDAAVAIDQGVVLEDAGLDLDGEPRDAAPDLGADEL